MKKVLILSMLTSFTICSCQKQDSAAKQQHAQRNAELDAREKALDERVNALDDKVNSLDGKVNALAEKERATANALTIPTRPQTQASDPARMQAERDAAIQQFSADMARIHDDVKREAESNTGLGQRLHELEQLQSQRQRKLEMSRGAAFPAAGATSPTPSPTPQ
jgi:DNA repair exonuclease SbcCD ATPase subunit